MDFSLNIFTLNCWGIPGISKNRKERIEAIGKYLSDANHNLVCLQEIWGEEDYLFFKERLKLVLPYSHYFYSGVLGSGLCIFSKWQIQDVFFHQWPLNGYIHKVHHGDWFGGKGIGLCRIKCNETLINVYCTHLHAEYHGHDMYLAHRVLQAYSTAEFVKLTTSPADISILAGDLNTAPGDLSYRLISELPALIDPFYLDFESSDPKVRRASGTCDNANNSYSNVKLAEKCPDGKRIDHILFHVNPSWEVHIENFGNPLEDRVPGQPFSYSDHNAVTLQLKLKPSGGKRFSKTNSTNVTTLDETVTDAIRICKEAKDAISRSKKVYLTSGGLVLMFLIGTLGFWPNYLIYDIVKIVLSGFCFYCLAMGSIWNQIELNSVKAGLTGLENLRNSSGEKHLHSA